VLKRLHPSQIGVYASSWKGEYDNYYLANMQYLCEWTWRSCF